jgi:hypothetical protein
MARQVNNEQALGILDEVFGLAEQSFREGETPALAEEPAKAIARLFKSETQAYREALIGCAIAHIVDPKIDVRLPATELGIDAFSGRSLADKVVTPFMRSREVPVSTSPYLSSLRGGARFEPGGEPRIQRDQHGFLALCKAVDYLRGLDETGALHFLHHLLWRFVELRESGTIALRRIAKPNLSQLAVLISGLMELRSGGRIPSFLAIALFQTISECHKLGWEIDFQGINVADKFTGAVGDITVRKDGEVVLGVEITERTVEKDRVALVFKQKVSPGNVRDYLFISTAQPADEAVNVARNYTAVGHEMNFVQLKDWLLNNLATLGPDCRTLFQNKLADLVGSLETPAELKVAWNDKMDIAIGASVAPD